MATSFFLEVTMKLEKKTIKGIDVNYLQIKKFKHMLIAFSFYTENKKNDYNERNLLPSLLENYNRIYKTSDQLNVALDMLYGADFFSGTYQRGHLFSNQFFLKLINQKYIQETNNLMEIGFQLLYDVIFKTKMYQQKIIKKAVKDKIKEAKDALSTIRQDKATLAYFNFLKKVTGSGLPSFFPYEPTYDLMNQDSFTRIYQEMIEHDDLKIYVIGDFDQAKADAVIDRIFKEERLSQSIDDIPIKQRLDFNGQVEEWVDYDDVSISRIYLGYHLRVKRHSKKEIAAEILNKIIGGDAQSKLFRVIREELQMVYMIYSSFLSEIDLLMIHFETESQDETKAINQAKNIIENIKQGMISETEIHMAKQSLIKSYKSISDKIFGIVKMQMNEDIMTHQTFDINQKIDMILSVSKDDLIDLAQELSLSHIYRFVREDEDHE
jgi:predicted Zn-dependent peptidase